jgi:hypothetical protein
MVVFGLSFMVPIAPFGVFGSVFAAVRGQVVGAYLIGAGVSDQTAWSTADSSSDATRHEDLANRG